MLLKKQTVWLLTMLSLVVVLSVYYLTTPPEKGPSNMAATEQKQDKQLSDQVKQENKQANKQEDKQVPAVKKENKSGAAVVTEQTGDNAFETLRLEINDSREKQKEDLTTEMGNTELTPEERSKAKASINEIDAISQKELIIESMIVSMNYDAALVRVNGKDINITVKSDKQSNEAANSIIELVSDEFKDAQNVAVDFLPKK